MVLHTFDRDLKLNPHIHCLISEGGFSDDAFWRNIHYFDYTFLRNAFRTALLDLLQQKLSPLLKLLKPFATLNINMAFMFMLNLISATQKLSLNTLADILDALLSLLPESIITMADRLHLH